jgi:hypothetical protein
MLFPYSSSLVCSSSPISATREYFFPSSFPQIPMISSEIHKVNKISTLFDHKHDTSFCYFFLFFNNQRASQTLDKLLLLLNSLKPCKYPTMIVVALMRTNKGEWLLWWWEIEKKGNNEWRRVGDKGNCRKKRGRRYTKKRLN